MSNIKSFLLTSPLASRTCCIRHRQAAVYPPRVHIKLETWAASHEVRHVAIGVGRSKAVTMSPGGATDGSGVEIGGLLG